MDKIIDKGVFFTQSAELPIEERVFFRQAIGIGVNDGRFREATAEELEAKVQYERKMEEYERAIE